MEKELIKDFPVSKLIPYDRNPRINKNAVEAVIRSIKRTGNIDPIEINENNIILCGHTRAKALQKLGINKTDILCVSGLTEQQQIEYRILNNKTAEIAEWDFEILEADFTSYELIDMGFDIKTSDGYGTEFTLQDGDRTPFQKMAFIVADEQAEFIKNIITELKRTDEYKYIETFGNENSNGNILYLMATKCQL